jgi:hypothetical protein
MRIGGAALQEVDVVAVLCGSVGLALDAGAEVVGGVIVEGGGGGA